MKIGLGFLPIHFPNGVFHELNGAEYCYSLP